MSARKIDPPDPVPDEFTAFSDLAKKLVKVPKKELDEARDREKAAKG